MGRGGRVAISGSSSGCDEQALLFDPAHRFLRAGASLVSHRLWAHGLR